MFITKKYLTGFFLFLIFYVDIIETIEKHREFVITTQQPTEHTQVKKKQIYEGISPKNKNELFLKNAVIKPKNHNWSN